MRSFLHAFFILLSSLYCSGQTTVQVQNNVDEHFFTFDEIHVLEDSTNELSFYDVSSGKFSNLFKPNTLSTPQTNNLNSSYWFRIKIRQPEKQQKKYLLEFFDQTIDHITAYLPQQTGAYTKQVLGDLQPFSTKSFNHKNFELEIDPVKGKENIYYFKVKSSQRADIIIVLRSYNRFLSYAVDEYFSFGIFYGMILVFSLYNLLMFLVIRQRQYLDYVLYLMSVAIYQMSIDGIGYQYLWPAFPKLNTYSYGIALYFVSLFALLFTRDLLRLKTKAPVLYRVINYTIAIRSGLFLVSFINPILFTYRFIEIIPLILSFISGIYIYRNGYKAARFFVFGCSFLFLGFVIKLLIEITQGAFNIGVLSYYSLNICFIIQMVLLSIALSDHVRVLKLRKDQAQRRIIQEMKENTRLKDIMNKELEALVNQRAREIIEKSSIIERQYQELKQVNTLLKTQSDEIARMNILLEKDNTELKDNITQVTRARIMSEEVDFTEFSKIYPDQDSCYKFLSELKWNKGYTCRKCSNESFFNGHIPYSKRCSKCSYEESVTTNTIFHNTRIPITKAFYMIFLIYSSNGKISSHKLAEVLAIRQSTCWTYSSKIKKVMEGRKKILRGAGSMGWSKIVIND